MRRENLEIMSALQTAVPASAKGLMVVQQAKVPPGQSLPAPLLNQFTGSDFEKKLTKQVIEVLFNTLVDDSSSHLVHLPKIKMIP